VLGSGASLEQVRQAAKAAQALDFIERLPEGFATRLGDGGSQLSGGQLQRLAVARAIMRNPRVSQGWAE
jgi:ABC-type multidrug transport system fused ATPase/permease subunit